MLIIFYLYWLWGCSECFIFAFAAIFPLQMTLYFLWEYGDCRAIVYFIALFAFLLSSCKLIVKLKTYMSFLVESSYLFLVILSVEFISSCFGDLFFMKYWPFPCIFLLHWYLHRRICVGKNNKDITKKRKILSLSMHLKSIIRPKFKQT